MTKQPWLTSPNHFDLLSEIPEKISPRKICLLACAMVRRLEALQVSDRAFRVVHLAEEVAENPESFATIRALENTLRSLWRDELFLSSPGGMNSYYALAGLVGIASRLHKRQPTRPIDVGIIAQNSGLAQRKAGISDDEYYQAMVVRDIVPSPFQVPLLDSRWLKPDVLQIAQIIYQERTFADLPILGDILVESGCSSPEILEHCFGPGPHARGCWLIDWILGNEPGPFL